MEPVPIASIGQRILRPLLALFMLCVGIVITNGCSRSGCSDTADLDDRRRWAYTSSTLAPGVHTPHGHAEARDQCNRIRIAGTFARATRVGEWKYYDRHGSITGTEWWDAGLLLRWTGSPSPYYAGFGCSSSERTAKLQVGEQEYEVLFFFAPSVGESAPSGPTETAWRRLKPAALEEIRRLVSNDRNAAYPGSAREVEWIQALRSTVPELATMQPSLARFEVRRDSTSESPK